MPETKLIVLDGLPGSGKSTNGEWLAQHLIQQGRDARFLSESDTSHPLWWYDYWDGLEYHPPDYQNIPIDTFISNSLTRWQEFVLRTQAAPETVTVAESVFFQDAVGMFIMGDAQMDQLRAYAHTVQQLARPLQPRLVYFRQDDIQAALRRICTIRGRDFQQELIANMESFPYLRNRNLKGFEGITQLWQAIQSLTDSLFAEYAISKISIETSTETWPAYRREILEFINM